MKTIVFSPQIFVRDTRRCEFKFLCNCFIHSSLMPNNTFCLYFQVTLQTENKRIGQHGKHTNCLSNERTFPFIGSHTNSQQKTQQEPKCSREDSVSEPCLSEWQVSVLLLNNKCSYLLGGIVCNLIFMSGFDTKISQYRRFQGRNRQRHL